VHSLTGHLGAILSMVVHKDLLFSGSADCAIRGWDTDDGACVAICDGQRSVVVALEANADYLFSGGSDSIIRQWTVKPDWGTWGKNVMIQCINIFDNKSNAAINCLFLAQDTIFCARNHIKNEKFNAIDIWSLKSAKENPLALPSTMIQDFKVKLRELTSLQTTLNEQLLAMRVKRRTASIRNQKIIDREASDVTFKLNNVEMVIVIGQYCMRMPRICNSNLQVNFIDFYIWQELKSISCSLGRGR
jgi:WD40 repeat protein